MAGSVAGIALPEGDPAAIFDAAASLGGAAAAFEDSSRTVGGAVAQLGGWQGVASQSFRVLAAGYEQAGARAAAVVREAAVAVRGYGVRFEDAYEAVKRLQREAEVCVDEIERWQRRRADAEGREAAARTRATDAVLGAGLDLSGGALAAQAQAYREADAAATDRLAAERKLAAAREELEDLRKRAAVERERAEEAESVAARQVQSAEAGLPAVLSPGGAGAGPALGWGTGPAVYRGGVRIGDGVYRGGATNRFADFDVGDILEFSRDVDREMGPVDEAINEGAKKVEGVGREVLGINDAEASKDAFARGDILSGIFHAILANPFGKGGKVIKEAGEEGLEQLGKQAVKGISDDTSEAIAKRAEDAGIPLRNKTLAGQNHPVSGVPFRKSGFPDFTRYADQAAEKLGRPATVRVDGITGKYDHDFALANKAAGFDRTPAGYTWHHVEDCRTMQLVPLDVHRKTGHSGCVQLLKNGIVEP